MTYELYDHNKCKLEIISSLNLFVVDFFFWKVRGCFFTLTRFLSVLLMKGFSKSGKVPLLHSCHFLVNQLWLLLTYLMCFSSNNFYLTLPTSVMPVYGLSVSQKFRGSFAVENFVLLVNSSHCELVHQLRHFACRIL